MLSSTGASTQLNNEEDDGEISDEEISNLVKTISYPGIAFYFKTRACALGLCIRRGRKKAKK